MVLKNLTITYVYLITSQNNVHVSFSQNNKVLGWLSSKAIGFTGKKKSTKAAAESLGYFLFKRLKEKKLLLSPFTFKFRGTGSVQKVFIKRLLALMPINIIKFQDCTPLAHNGCRWKKRKHKNWRKRKKFRASYRIPSSVHFTMRNWLGV